MNTDDPIKPGLVRVLACAILVALVFAPAASSAREMGLAAWLIAFPEWDSVEGYDWPQGQIVHLAIDDPNTLASPDHEQDETVVETPWGEGFYVKFNFWGEYDLKSSDILTLTHAETSQTHFVQNLSVTDVDNEADTVSGEADPGAEVRVNSYDDWGLVMTTTVTAEGTWSVDFAGAGLDLVAGSGGRSQIFDAAGNATAVDWSTGPPPPSPWFTAFPPGVVEGWDWPLGATIHLTIDDPSTAASPDYEQDETIIEAPWGSGELWVWFEFGGAYEMKAGDVVTLTDGETERTHVVRNLSITGADSVENTVSGTADAGAEVTLWPWEDPVVISVTTSSAGNWTVDFDDVGYDLMPGMDIRASVQDEAGNDTAQDWYIPIPFIWADPIGNYINGWDWSEGSTITLNLYDDEDVLLHSDSQPYAGGVGFDIQAEGIDLQAGNRVTMSDGVTEKELIVSPLWITGIDPDARTISGIYDPDPSLGFWINIAGEEPEDVTFDGDQWVATFAELPGGARGEVAQPDEDGDMTGFSIVIPARIFLPLLSFQ